MMSWPKCTFITGASSGIGAEFARVAAHGSSTIVLAARREEELKALAAEIMDNHPGVQVECCPIDLTEPGASEKITGFLASRKLEPDCLVNNAGFGYYGPFCEADPAMQLSMVRLNCTALLDLTQSLLPAMIANRRGYICNVASVAAFQPGPGMAVYYATKAFVLHLSEALSVELAPKGIHVSALCPGSTDTPFHRIAGSSKVRSLQRMAMRDARSVAESGWEAMLRGRAVAVPGLLNRLLGLGHRFLPRSWVARLSARFMKE